MRYSGFPLFNLFPPSVPQCSLINCMTFSPWGTRFLNRRPGCKEKEGLVLDLVTARIYSQDLCDKYSSPMSCVLHSLCYIELASPTLRCRSTAGSRTEHKALSLSVCNRPSIAKCEAPVSVKTTLGIPTSTSRIQRRTIPRTVCRPMHSDKVKVSLSRHGSTVRCAMLIRDHPSLHRRARHARDSRFQIGIIIHGPSQTPTL